ncbi:MAG: hypothetical protein V4636_02310 [Pseudomonadota bacterium]
MVNAASNTNSSGAANANASASGRVMASAGAGAQAQATGNVQHAPHADPAAIASNARAILKLAPEIFKRETHLPLPGGMVLRMTSSGDAVIIQSEADRLAGGFNGLSIARDPRDPEGTPLFTIDMDRVGHDWPAMAAWADQVKAGSDACTQNKAGFFRRWQNKALVAFNVRSEPSIAVRDQDTERFKKLLPATRTETEPAAVATAASASVPASESATATASATALTLAARFGVSPREPVTAAQFDASAFKSSIAVKRALAMGAHFTLQIGDKPVTVTRSHAGDSYEARPVEAARTGQATTSHWVEVIEDELDGSVRVTLNNATIDGTHPDAAAIALVMAAVSTHARSLKM